MSIVTAFSVLAAIWCTIHLVHYFAHSRDGSLLPTQSHSRGRRAFFGFHYSRHTQTSLSGLKFQVSTTRWNTVHDKLGSFLARRGNQHVAAAVRWFYTAGTALGALGMAVAVFVLVAKTSTGAWAVLQKMEIGPIPSSFSDPTSQTLSRRNAFAETVEDGGGPPLRPGASIPAITPIIPGLTVPFSHLPIIVAAVFISQALHELGHALAATLEFLPMKACGASLVVCVPAAFVSFPDSGMKGLNPHARARIIAAGPFHNIVFWGCLALAMRVGVAGIVASVSGYQNVSGIGRVVVQIASDSPLSLHLQPGAIITKLDDISLASPDDKWTEILLQGKGESTTSGWCVQKTVLARTEDCCAPSAKPSPLSCFVTYDRLARGCIDPVPVMTTSTGRCASADACSDDHSTCVVSRKDTQLLRLTVSSAISQLDEQTVVLWRGAADEIWDEVQVSPWLPRIWILPLWLPPLLSLFYEYLTMATLSLYFFNLLPLPYLDGTQLLDALLDAAFAHDQAEAYDFAFTAALEAGRGHDEAPRTRRRWKQRIVRYTTYAMVSVGGCFVVVSVVDGIY